MLDLVFMLWISWLVEYKSLFFTTNNRTENIYWACKSRISSRLNNSASVESAIDYIVHRKLLHCTCLTHNHFTTHVSQAAIPVTTCVSELNCSAQATSHYNFVQNT